MPLFATSGGDVGERHFKAAARSLAAFAVLVNGCARQLGEQGLRHAAHLGVVRRHAGQRTAVAPDDDPTVVLFDLRETAQLVEHSDRRLEPRACATGRGGLSFGHAVPHRPQHWLGFLWPVPLRQHVQEPAKDWFVALREQVLGLGRQLVDVGGLPPPPPRRTEPRCLTTPSGCSKKPPVEC
jgi:hypothetical protein